MFLFSTLLVHVSHFVSYALNDFLSQTYIICGSGNDAAVAAVTIHNK